VKPLVREAVLVSRELDGAVFVGAVAQYAHTKIFRESEDVDLALRRPLSEEYLNSKKYSKHDENGKQVWRTPRGIKIDMYTTDVSRIPIDVVVSTAESVPVKNGSINVLSLECLIIAKHRAGRDQDVEDLHSIAQAAYSKIDWASLGEVAESDVEYRTVETAMRHMKNT